MSVTYDPNISQSTLWNAIAHIVKDHSVTIINAGAGIAAGSAITFAYYMGMQPNPYEWIPDLLTHGSVLVIKMLPKSSISYYVGGLVNGARTAHIIYKTLTGSNFPDTINVLDFVIHSSTTAHFFANMNKEKED